ncbi:MAG: IS66 family insertion sequence element accessory protein TnpB, partial [Verrucomicrobiales bacterium]|nr:IS66 family insertion sequence element accessory protein TnpB [Verrucomicrobiales bacterium]
ALVTQRLGEDPRTGALFVFSNRRHTRLRILCWDGTGFWLLTNRHAPQCPLRKIRKGTLSLPSAVRKDCEGIWFRGRPKRYRLYSAAEQCYSRDSWVDVR